MGSSPRSPWMPPPLQQSKSSEFLFRGFIHFGILLAMIVTVATSVRAEDFSTLELFGDEEPVVSTSRVPRPVSKIAENVTVVTADQITRLNAHTLAELLNSVSGIQMQTPNRTPGSTTDTFVQGAEAGLGHVLVLIDGVQTNNYLQGWAEVGSMPVQMIERVEVVKGPASTAWGPALGGVINVITRDPEPEGRFNGTFSVSAGERSTVDVKGDLGGTAGGLGYYVSGGKASSGGLRPNNDTDSTNGFFKLTRALPREGTLTAGGGIWEAADGDAGLLDSSGWLVHDNQKNHFGYTYLTLQQPLGGRLALEATARTAYREMATEWNDVIDGRIVPFSQSLVRESTWGGGVKLSWTDSRFGVISGIDYDHANVHTSNLGLVRRIDRLGLYANGFFTFGRLTVLPGFRYDHTGLGGEKASFNLGATFRLTDKTVLRAYGAEGYALPNLVYGKELQRVWSVQTGVESTEIPCLWLKGTLFYNRLRDAMADANASPDRRQTKQGFEVEARTVSWHDISLTGGYTFNDSRDSNRDRHQMKPAHIGKLGVLYDNTDMGFTGTLTGSYVWWNSPATRLARYDTMLWDLHLAQKVPVRWPLEPEVFVSVRNLFNGSQYAVILYQNASRWVEGGVRFRF